MICNNPPFIKAIMNHPKSFVGKDYIKDEYATVPCSAKSVKINILN